jgi:hypothetical protein
LFAKYNIRFATTQIGLIEVQRGFVINGEAVSDYSGHSVSNAGDVNGDGLDDLIVGAYQADLSGKSDDPLIHH